MPRGALLAQRRFHEWIELLTDDVHYWMPVRTSRYEKTSKSIVILDDAHDTETDVSGEHELAILDEDKDSLRMRHARLDTSMAWAEEPPSRTRHLLSNIAVEEGETASELTVYSNIIVYRSRAKPSRIILSVAGKTCYATSMMHGKLRGVPHGS